MVKASKISKNCMMRNANISESFCDHNSEQYFGIKIRNKQYPSCYRYNILVMLAKRLLNEEKQMINPCKLKSNPHALKYNV